MKHSATTATAPSDMSYRSGIIGVRERLLVSWLKRIHIGRLTVGLPSGAHRTFVGSAPGPHAFLDIRDMRVVTRMLWGGFAEIASRDFGCEVVCLTLSTEQAAFTQGRMARHGLTDKVEVRLQDYRDVSEIFDHIVSIEMFEAVGEAYWPTYFGVIDKCLKSGGRVALQSITIDATHFEHYRRNPDFIQRYIFPGGMLPSPEALSAAAAQAGFTVASSVFFGKSYAETLRRWDQAFRDNWDEIAPLGFDERFYRMWRYYLSYCEVGFDHAIIDVGQFVFERP